MAKKNNTLFVCSACGYTTTKWAGKCASCGAWDTLTEDAGLSVSGPAAKSLGQHKGKMLSLETLASTQKDPPRMTSGIQEFDRALGGGVVQGAAILVGGDPGIGKSTLLLQAAGAFANNSHKVIYISGEEATSQIKGRADRLGLRESAVLLGAETNVRNILTTLEQERPAVAIIDSIQTMWADHVESAPGSVSQVRACAHELTTFAKRRNVAVLLVGHVTKEGQIAGPRVVEHMVDTVLYFEGERGHQFRILRAVKNRFGPSDEIGVFEMQREGLMEVANPSALFLSDRDQGVPGSMVFAGMEGTRPVLVEVQALVAPSSLGTPRRAVVGWDSGRLSMLIAVLEARCGVSLAGQDVYLNIAGGFKVSDPAADLAVATALLSAYAGTPAPSDAVAFGEISLSGSVRTVSQSDTRLKEAEKLGFVCAYVPTAAKTERKSVRLVKIDGLHTLTRLYSQENEGSQA